MCNRTDEIINMLKELVKISSVQSAPEEGGTVRRACAEVLEYVKSCWQKNGLTRSFIGTADICCHITAREEKHRFVFHVRCGKRIGRLDIYRAV